VSFAGAFLIVFALDLVISTLLNAAIERAFAVDWGSSLRLALVLAAIVALVDHWRRRRAVKKS
jgi:hypothetical protein